MEINSRDNDVAAIALLDEPVRRRLYEWVVAQHEPVGRDAAAAALGITRALAAFHLDRLTRGGLLKKGYRRLTGRSGPGAGRPARVYSRGEREVSVSLPERHYARAAGLFAEALEKAAGPATGAALHDAAANLGKGLARSTAGRRGTPRKLLNVLAANGYEPLVDGTGTIRLRNCPFHELVAEHRQLVCGTNLALAEGIANGAGTSYQPVIDMEPGFCCVSFVQGERDV